VHDYAKRLPDRFMAEKSASSVYIGAPDESAEWAGHTVDGILNGAAETGMNNKEEQEDAD